MTTKNLREEYESKYGLAAKMVLRQLGGDPDAIIEKYADKIDSKTEGDALFFSSVMTFFKDTCDADNIHNEILKEIERLYFSSLSRDAAVAICNALIIGGEISITTAVDGLSYNGCRFMAAWNAENPDKQKILPPVGIDI